MTKKKVLLTRIFPKLATQLLEDAGYEVIAWDKEQPMPYGQMIEAAQSCNALFCTLTDKIDSTFLNACSHLDIITQYAVGYDNIDVEQATKLGIPIGYAPNAMTEATADIAFGLMIATARKMFFMNQKIKNGKWGYFDPVGHLGLELKDKTLGILGLGRIGMAMAQRCKGAYNMEILYHNRTANPNAEDQIEAKLVDFDTLISQSDVISVHCALTPSTQGIFNKSVFEKMKPTSLFINTARGGVHNEKDLIDALNNGNIWGAGLDVTNPEPMKPNNPLLTMENVCVLPHIGSATITAREEMAKMAATNIISFYEKGEVPFIVNPEVL
ncbi:D-glycerate dehydrogenase [Flagellimonas hymeniacidonis]|uniref:Glyoxylate/hydroxypyruvate reductase B n=1 Tax=Flagellimonas hymeniacidonis TaxID=2603628 RepID=A0A5C8V1G9_9FLAO|nr:D-glycerate dehydrogenase [Flagellimonas hymeniacidonis]TXN34745.1 D-glycerate dehydrogenase [Flagellimonas hymeniacidonis]